MATDLKKPGEVGTELIPYERGGAQRFEPRPSSSWEPEPQGGSEVSLMEAWHILVKRRWTIVTTVLVLVTLVTIATFRTKPVYRASARVAVEADTSQIQSINDLYQKTPTDDAFVQTQLQVLKSENLAWRTIEQLQMQANKHFIADPKALAALDSDRRKYELIDAFQENLTVELLPKTRMLVISFESTDPKLASQVATAHVNNYVDFNFREKYSATKQASGWMEQQLDELKAKVEQSQQALVDYERKFSIAQTGDKDRQNVSEQMLSDLSREWTNAQSERIQKEAKYNRIRSNREEVVQLADNDLLGRLKEKQADLRNQYVEALANYGPNFPKVQRLKQQGDELEAQVTREQTRVIERVREEFQAAQNRERLAQQAVTRQKEELSKLNDLLVQHNILKRDFETNQQMYQSLLQRLKDATVSAGLRSTNIHIVDTALPPGKPVRPRKLLNIAVGLLAGLVLGVILAFGGEALDQSIKSLEEVESITGVPALGAIPKDTSGSSLAVLVRPPGGATMDSPMELTVVQNPKSTVAEAFRALRTSILLSTASEAPKLILVTSSNPGEGKTTTALNLAHVMAQRKGPVLLLDCDLRKTGVARVLALDNSKGLTTLLTGQHDLESSLQQSAQLPALWFLTSGEVPPNPAELLSSDRMLEVLAELRTRFEHIIIDSPPVLAVTDATVLSRVADGVVLVAESGATPRAGLARTTQILENAGAKILGVAMNKIDVRRDGYYGNYYGKYYGDGYPDGRRSGRQRG